jgi:hypothetical protein
VEGLERNQSLSESLAFAGVGLVVTAWALLPISAIVVAAI